MSPQEDNMRMDGLVTFSAELGEAVACDPRQMDPRGLAESILTTLCKGRERARQLFLAFAFVGEIYRHAPSLKVVSLANDLRARYLPPRCIPKSDVHRLLRLWRQEAEKRLACGEEGL
jgi:hypothetical protein